MPSGLMIHKQIVTVPLISYQSVLGIVVISKRKNCANWKENVSDLPTPQQINLFCDKILDEQFILEQDFMMMNKIPILCFKNIKGKPIEDLIQLAETTGIIGDNQDNPMAFGIETKL